MVKTEAMDSYLQSLADGAGITGEESTQNVMNFLGGIPMGRMASPGDVAEFVGYLVSPRASYLSGANYTSLMAVQNLLFNYLNKIYHVSANQL